MSVYRLGAEKAKRMRLTGDAVPGKKLDTAVDALAESMVACRRTS
jgi:hypothetical protein